MKPRPLTLTLWVLSAAVVACAAWEWWRSLALRREVARLRSHAVDLAPLRAEDKRLREIQVPAATLENLRAAHAALPQLREEIAALRSIVSSPASASATPLPPASRVAAPKGGDGRYADFFAQLQLTPAQVTQLRRLIETRDRNLERRTTMLRDATPEMAKSILKRADLADPQSYLESRIRETFGQQVFISYRSYEWESSARRIVANLARVLEKTPTPLTGEQHERLIATLLRQTLADFEQRGAMLNAAPRDYHLLISEETLERAKEFLSSAQVAALLTLHSHQRATPNG